MHIHTKQHMQTYRLAHSHKHIIAHTQRCTQTHMHTHISLVKNFCDGQRPWFHLAPTMCVRERLLVLSRVSCQLGQVFPDTVIFQRNESAALPWVPTVPQHWKYRLLSQHVSRGMCTCPACAVSEGPVWSRPDTSPVPGLFYFLCFQIQSSVPPSPLCSLPMSEGDGLAGLVSYHRTQDLLRYF
jgi:hypothetical protein